MREEDVLDHEMLETAQESDRAALISLAAGRVLAHDVERVQVPSLHRFEHLAQVPAFFARELRPAPCARELVVNLRVLEVLESRHSVRDRAHVAAALDVDLATQRCEAAAVAPHLAR